MRTKRMITHRGWQRFLATLPLRLLLLAALPALMLTACSTDDLAPDNTSGATTSADEEGKIIFDISIAPPDDDGLQTRVATGTNFKSEWEEGDEVGVFSVLANPASTNDIIPRPGHLKNVKLTYTKEKGWVGDIYWPPFAATTRDTAVVFFAYYPYDAAATDPTNIAFAVKTDQSNKTDGKPNYNLSDLLYGESTRYYKRVNKPTVKLNFVHALSLVQVNVPVETTLKGSGPNDELEVSLIARPKVKLNMHTVGAINLKALLANNDNDPVAIRMQRVEDPANTTSYTYRALIPVQKFAKGSRIFRLNHEGRQLFIDAPLKDDVSLGWKMVAKFTRTMPLSALQTVRIPAGRFQMGSPTTETGRETNETQHWVTLTKGFRICQYEITCAQFAEFLNAVKAEYLSTSDKGDNYTQAKYKDKLLLSVGETYNYTVQWIKGKWAAPSGAENFPVNYVSWYGADEYARWVGGSLPTEAQWEYACRAGTETPWSFGGDASKIGEYAWYILNSNNIYHDVGTKMPNKWELYDMHGNVGEWCLDYATGNTPAGYGSDDATDPVNNDPTNYHILRGGYHSSAAEYCRSARRTGQEVDVPGANCGFRVIFPDK